MMNKKVIKELESRNFKVLPEVNFIVEETISEPHSYITYDEKKDRFGIIILPIQIYGSENIKMYTQEVASKLDLINRLNFYCQRGE